MSCKCLEKHITMIHLMYCVTVAKCCKIASGINDLCLLVNLIVMHRQEAGMTPWSRWRTVACVIHVGFQLSAVLFLASEGHLLKLLQFHFRNRQRSEWWNEVAQHWKASLVTCCQHLIFIYLYHFAPSSILCVWQINCKAAVSSNVVVTKIVILFFSIHFYHTTVCIA